MSDLGFMENIETLLAAVAQTQGFDDDEPVTVTASVPKLVNSGSSPEIRGCVGGSQQVGAPPEVSGDTRPSGVVNPPPMVPSVVQVIGTVEKRKRGRPPKGTVSMKPPPPKRIKKQEKAVEEEEEEEEDFCFVCLDGGSLVLCDRKGCPKAYHASCVKRDEVFFKSKAKWNCGWHICTVCLKASYYMCYTCPYSLCKGCSKDADYLRVRGSKGFCNTCMKIIMLIENKDQASSDSAVQVDFDDTTSWEYLFKTYWVILKEKLSLTMEELTRAKNPWRDVAPADCKPQLSNVCHTAVDGKVSVPNSSFEHLEMSKLQEVHNDGSTSARLANVKDEPIITPEPGTHKQLTERAVDDTTTKDAADQGTIDKPHIDPAEMPKLHDSHVLVKEDSQKNSLTSAGFVTSDMEVDRNILDHLIGIKSRKLEKCKKHDERATQNNSSKYAAIDVHNVNLIYLRRNLMESLIEDNNFQDKVVGSIVRIRISSHDQKPDVYRLVQVVGIYKVTEPYKIGDKMAGIMLEVLNLGKKEVVSIDAISNQEFTEAECRELDQYARCGLLKQYTLDEVQKKAMALQSVRFDDWLEAEAFRLYHLLDQASKKGCEEEVSEYIRIIQLLKSPEERRRRISEVPEIHPYVEMGQNQETEDAKSGDKNTKDAHASPRHYESPLNGDKPVSPNEKDKEEGPIQAHSKKMENVDASLEQNMMQVDSSNSAINGGDNQGFVSCELEKSSAAAAKPLTDDNIEIEKLWHYRDSNGKIQGPFSMVHLRLSHTTRQFPPDMRIWTNHEQFDSLLLTDALNGKLHGAPELPNNPSSEAINGNNRDSKQTDAALSSNASASPNNNGGSTRADEASWPKCWDLFKDKSSSAHNIPASSSIPSLATDLVRGCDENTEKNSSGPAQIETAHQILASQSSEEKLIHLPIGLSLNDIEPRSVPEPELEPRKPISVKQEMEIDVFNLPSPKHWGVPSTEKHQSESSNVPIQNQGFLELLSPKRRSDSDDQESVASETKQSAPIDLSVPNSGLSWSGLLNMVQFPEMANNWCGYSSTPAKPNDPIHAEGMSDNIVTPGYNQFTHVSPPNPACTAPSWLAMINEPIEFDAYGEESVSDLLAEVDAMESQENLPSPTSAMKFAKELLQDCKDGCFSSIEDFIPTSNPVRSDALSSTKEIQLSCQSSVSCKPIVPSLIGTLDSFSKSGMRSSESSTGETSAPVYSEEAGSQFHQAPPNMGQDMVGATMAPGMGSESSNPGWGPVQGNINLVTVQGNVNLILGGPPQGMTNLGWGANQGTWGNPNINHTLQNGSLPWDGQRMYSGGREWGYQGVETGFGRGRSPWGRPPYGGGGGYSRPLPKGQRVCKFYESGRCKKGALCDYLHP